MVRHKDIAQFFSPLTAKSQCLRLTELHRECGKGFLGIDCLVISSAPNSEQQAQGVAGRNERKIVVPSVIAGRKEGRNNERNKESKKKIRKKRRKEWWRGNAFK